MPSLQLTGMMWTASSGRGTLNPSNGGVCFVGSYGPADSPGIYSFAFDQDAKLELLGAHAGIQNPSYLAIHPDGNHLYAVSETGLDADGAQGSIHAFRLERRKESVELVDLNSRSAEGDHPCHLTVDAAGEWIAASNYGSGSVAVFPIRSDGALGPVASLAQHGGSGPTPRQEGPHTHSALFTPDSRFLLVADLGIDRILTYALDRESGSLSRRSQLATGPGSGPRHLALHPDGERVLFVNELDNTISLCAYDPSKANLTHLQNIPTLPRDAPDNTAADIQVSPSGTHVYVSNRGHDSLAVYTFDDLNRLHLESIRPTGGQTPRSFSLAPDGRHIVVANRQTDDLVVLPLLQGGSEIGPPVSRVEVPQASFVTFA